MRGLMLKSTNVRYWYQAFYLTLVRLFIQTCHSAFELRVRFPVSRLSSATHWLSLYLSLHSPPLPSSHLDCIMFRSPILKQKSSSSALFTASCSPSFVADCLKALAEVVPSCSPLSLPQWSTARPPRILNGLKSCGTDLSCLWIKLLSSFSTLFFPILKNSIINRFLGPEPSAKVKMKR